MLQPTLYFWKRKALNPKIPKSSTFATLHGFGPPRFACTRPSRRIRSTGPLIKAHYEHMIYAQRITSRTLSKAQELVTGLPRTRVIALDVSSTAELDSQIRSYDLVISLVPYMYHVAIITAAIKHKVNVVTTSYISDAMRELDAPAREAGIAVLNEVGVDPGVNHLYAIKTIDEVHSKGGKLNTPKTLSASNSPDPLVTLCPHNTVQFSNIPIRQ
ncbi:MAG: hypothetical protein L6R41_000309 [Letrouitia leprolyta]|nr:MAG: hypothetical protein L6R41_000309 [Letrouitia leprolyta]